MTSVTSINDGHGGASDGNGHQEPAGAGTAPGAGESRTTSGRFVPPPPPPQAEGERPSELPRHLAKASRFAGHQLLRPRVRLAIVGLALLVAAIVWAEGSLGTVLTVAGIVMLLVAWLGRRMQGRFAIEWGESGTRLEFDAGLKPAPEPPKPALNPARTSAPAAAAAAPPGDVIEGEAHTVEIDVGELRRLIAAAEQAERDRTG